MPPLLWESRVIHNPRYHRTVFLHGWQHLSPYLREHLFVIPWRIRYQMMERLVHAPNIG
jgi:hypothetical protein